MTDNNIHEIQANVNVDSGLKALEVPRLVSPSLSVRSSSPETSE